MRGFSVRDVQTAVPLHAFNRENDRKNHNLPDPVRLQISRLELGRNARLGRGEDSVSGGANARRQYEGVHYLDLGHQKGEGPSKP